MAFVAAPLPAARHHRHVPRTCITKRARVTPYATSAPPATDLAAPSAILTAAARARLGDGVRPAAADVARALSDAERASKKERLVHDGSQLLGEWQLVVTSDERKKLPPLRALYFPLDTRHTYTKTGRFRNCVRVLGGILEFSGPFRWAQGRNRMEFTFSELRVELGMLKWKTDKVDKEGGSLEGRMAKTLPFFTFFLVNEVFAAARGRGGGLALFARRGDAVD